MQRLFAEDGLDRIAALEADADRLKAHMALAQAVAAYPDEHWRELSKALAGTRRSALEAMTALHCSEDERREYAAEARVLAYIIRLPGYADAKLSRYRAELAKIEAEIVAQERTTPKPAERR